MEIAFESANLLFLSESFDPRSVSDLSLCLDLHPLIGDYGCKSIHGCILFKKYDSFHDRQIMLRTFILIHKGDR
jgi:hypothetical protein